jgi:hypothetical protein
MIINFKTKLVITSYHSCLWVTFFSFFP